MPWDKRERRIAEGLDVVGVGDEVIARRIALDEGAVLTRAEGVPVGCDALLGNVRALRGVVGILLFATALAGVLVAVIIVDALVI